MRRFLFVALMGSGALLLTATAASAASLTVDHSTVAAGGSVVVNGNCQASTSGFVISPAFLHDASHDFAGVGAVAFNSDAAGNFSATATIPATTSPGTYAITARCGGGNLGITVNLTVTAATTPARTGAPLPAMLLLALGLVAAGALVVAVTARRPARVEDAGAP